jgi:hypothetical protein
VNPNIKYRCPECNAEHYPDEMRTDDCLVGLEDGGSDEIWCDSICPSCGAWNDYRAWVEVPGTERPPAPQPPLPYSDHALRSEPDPEKQAAMIEARMADLRSRKPFTEEQFAFERSNMERLAAAGQRHREKLSKFVPKVEVIGGHDVERLALAAIAELERQYQSPRSSSGPYLYGDDPTTRQFDLRDVGVDGHVDLIALVEAILTAAEDGKEP